MNRTPLEPWILKRIGYRPGRGESPGEALARHQLERLRRTVDDAREKSPFYRRRLAGFSGTELRSLKDVARLPFTRPADLEKNALDFLCLSQSEIARVVTLCSSGTTAAKKRLHFTAEDLEGTIDFYHHGMATLTAPGHRVLILMPGELPGSVGDLLVKALPRLGATGILHGPATDAGQTLERIVAEKIDTLVGLPVQVLALARHPRAGQVRGRLKSVLLSADNVPQAVVAALRETWEAPVFNHYGMTEMGLGGGVECENRCGFHLREADFFWEVVDPKSGRPLPPGIPGEVVFTTLNRRGMPLIRYRTGDRARFLSGPCPCGTFLPRLGRIEGRFAGDVRLAGGEGLNIAELDEALFPLPFLLNYHPVLNASRDGERLDVFLQLQDSAPADAVTQVRRRLEEIPILDAARSAGKLAFGTIAPGPMPISSGVLKRRLEDRRKERP